MTSGRSTWCCAVRLFCAVSGSTGDCLQRGGGRNERSAGLAPHLVHRCDALTAYFRPLNSAAPRGVRQSWCIAQGDGLAPLCWRSWSCAVEPRFMSCSEASRLVELGAIRHRKPSTGFVHTAPYCVLSLISCVVDLKAGCSGGGAMRQVQAASACGSRPARASRPSTGPCRLLSTHRSSHTISRATLDLNSNPQNVDEPVVRSQAVWRQGSGSDRCG